MEEGGLRLPDPAAVLLTGVDGWVGSNLAATLADRAVVRGLFQARPVAVSGCTTEPWDPRDARDVRQRVLAASPHWIVHCGALARGSWDLPKHAGQSHVAREESAVCSVLMGLAERLGARLTVISTDAVFSGPRLFHDEQSPATGRDPVALAARQVEQDLARPGVLVVRTHAYGWSPDPTAPCFAEWAWQALAEGQVCSFSPWRSATPILASDLAELLWLSYRRGLEGCYHLAGAERTSAYRFAVELAAAFGLQGAVALASQKEPPWDGHVESLEETSLGSRRAQRALGRPLPMLREGLERFAQQARNGFRDRLRRRPAPWADAA
jgi:dTDP-4-dehydrorhamnose reductase